MNKRKIFFFPFSIDPLQFIDLNKGSITYFNGNDNKESNLLAWGNHAEIKLYDDKGAFEKLKDFQNIHNDWMTGFFAYDLKNDLEKLESKNPDDLEFPLLHFIVPELLIEINANSTLVYAIETYSFNAITIMLETAKSKFKAISNKKVETIFHGLEEEEYLKHFNNLIKHIHRGDIYEINYCLEFKSRDIQINPISTYYRLNEQTIAPFSIFYRDEEHFLLCGSPERYLKKEGNTILSQPIKGTIKRGNTPDEDEKLKEKLINDPKERAENVMIVDLVRNDLSRIATKASVKVNELFGVYSFKTVHQLISSITCKVKPDLHPVDIIKATFPMGSMTGAPKISAMNLIEENEDFKRGLYSGAFGYFSPDGDFDFNVVIRSILYNEKKRTVTFPVGGALTSLANAKNEYHECILKAKAMKKALQNIS
jgi:para-aminobenzoate synthetase component 1